MKTNFKTLATTAAVGAALAAGSMSAQAVVQAVPANAQLVPLFFHSTVGTGLRKTIITDTVVRVTVPKSVGVDQVVKYLNPETSPTGVYESQGDADLSPVIQNPTVLIPGGNNNQPLTNVSPLLSPANAIDQTEFPNSFIHWWFLSTDSKHIINGRIPVSQDDVVVFDAANLGTNGSVPTGNIFTGVSAIPSNVAGYLVLANESARNGGAPLFGFAADAWVTTPGAGMPSAVNIPVMGMADGVDTTTYPTPTNQVIQNQQFISGQFYPVASPLTSGIRYGVVGPNVPSSILKVVEAPLADRAQFNNQVFFWYDRNAQAPNGDMARDPIVPVEELDQDENPCSTDLSLPYQLNMVYVPTNVIGHLPGTPDGSPLPARLMPTALVDAYASTGLRTPGSAWWPNNRQWMQIGDRTVGYEPLCQSNTRDGFVKLYQNGAYGLPVGAAPGAYAAMVQFTLPQLAFAIDPTHLGLMPGQLSFERPTALGVDRGWFQGR